MDHRPAPRVVGEDELDGLPVSGRAGEGDGGETGALDETGDLEVRAGVPTDEARRACDGSVEVDEDLVDVRFRVDGVLDWV
ncbi:hypothetical protein [Agrococcus sp. HG114]|uniref:hypothetical protein n=1 Tax=Agrococcus sp. HG114 TaxID=2969757 RepID=UPI00215B6FD0|nr:hypothetical protein [Agrococcus sp. HG114]MCR8671379.1 hypothetical protein [Agrococcus sp. HG114]